MSHQNGQCGYQDGLKKTKRFLYTLNLTPSQKKAREVVILMAIQKAKKKIPELKNFILRYYKKRHIENDKNRLLDIPPKKLEELLDDLFEKKFT